MGLIKHYPILQKGLVDKNTAAKLREIGRDSFNPYERKEMEESPNKDNKSVNKKEK